MNDDATKGPERIECEVCGAHYDERVGSTNDCPSCGAASGKGRQMIVKSVEGEAISQPVFQTMMALDKALSFLSARVAALESRIAVLEARNVSSVSVGGSGASGTETVAKSTGD